MKCGVSMVAPMLFNLLWSLLSLQCSPPPKSLPILKWQLSRLEAVEVGAVEIAATEDPDPVVAAAEVPITTQIKIKTTVNKIKIKVKIKVNLYKIKTPRLTRRDPDMLMGPQIRPAPGTGHKLDRRLIVATP